MSWTATKDCNDIWRFFDSNDVYGQGRGLIVHGFNNLKEARKWAWEYDAKKATGKDKVDYPEKSMPNLRLEATQVPCLSETVPYDKLSGELAVANDAAPF